MPRSYTLNIKIIIKAFLERNLELREVRKIAKAIQNISVTEAQEEAN